MRFPRAKFTIPALMAVVAAAACVLALVHMWVTATPRAEYLARAAWHAKEEAHWRQNIAQGIREGGANPFVGLNFDYDQPALAAYHSKMKLIYEHAAREPTKSLPPLPPEPALINVHHAK